MAQAWAAPRAAWDAPSEHAAEDVWGKFAASNAVDWARGFSDPEPAPAPAPSQAAQAAPRTDDALWAAFLHGSGVPAELVRTSPAEAVTAAAGLLRRLVAGLVVMLEARARAKAQLGAQSTTLELSGNNPLKFARSPEKVLAQLLSPPERGFMPADRAVEDSFQDLQAHQMATLAAMQGALRATVERFSPEAIRKRAETRGLLARILPSARDAALWEAYQKEFEGVARGSDEAFLDVFAKAFKEAYEKAAADMKRGG
jgi:type VI secretion system FHA domain protein